MFNAECKDEIDELKLFVVVPSELTKDHLISIFKNYDVENIYRALPPKNFAIVGPFSSTEESKRALLDLDNQPPFNLKIRFSKCKPRNETYQKAKTYQKNDNKESREKNPDYNKGSFTKFGSYTKSEGRASENNKFPNSRKNQTPTYDRKDTSFNNENKFHGGKTNHTVAQRANSSSNGSVTSFTNSIDAKNLYERAYMLLAREHFTEFKEMNWFKSFLKNMVYTYMSNVTNPKCDFQELYKTFKALEEDATSNGSDDAPIIPRNAVIERLFIVETCKVGTKANLNINSTGSEGNICSIILQGDCEEYESLLEKFSSVCETLQVVAESGSLMAGSGEIMAVKLASDEAWYRATTVHQAWALVDDSRTVTAAEVLKTVVCPKPFAEYPFYSCLLTHAVKNIKDWETSFQVEVLSIDKKNRVIDVNLSNDEYGRSFSGKLYPWIASITTFAAGKVNRTPNPPKIMNFFAENCSLNQKLNMSVVSKSGKGLVCITDKEEMAKRDSPLMKEFSRICENQRPIIPQAGSSGLSAKVGQLVTGSGDLMAVKLIRSRDNKEGWFRAIPHEQGWALADEGYTVTPLEIQKMVTCPPLHANIPFYSCLFTHDLKNFEGFPTKYEVEILKKDAAKRTLDVEVSNDEEGYKFKGCIQPWIPTVGGSQPMIGNIESFAKESKAPTHRVNDVPIATVPTLSAVQRVTPVKSALPQTKASPVPKSSLPPIAPLPKVSLPPKAAPSPKAASSPKAAFSPKVVPDQRPVTKSLAEVLNPGDEMNIIVREKDGNGMRCLVLHMNYQQNFRSLTAEFGPECEKQPSATPRGGTLMAVKLQDGSWFRAEWQNSLWLLMDDGHIATRADVQRVVTCPQAFVDFPFFSCQLTPVVANMTKDEPSYVAIILSKDEANQMVFVKVTGKKSQFTAHLQPLIHAPSVINEILPGNIQTAKASGVIKPRENIPKSDTVAKTVPTCVAVAPPKIIRYVAENFSVNDEIVVVPRVESQGITMCLHLSPEPENVYSTLFEKFAVACDGMPLVKAADGFQDIMAVKMAIAVDFEGWYRAAMHDQRWALLDDGRTVKTADIQQIVACPPSFVNIPAFCYHLTHDVQHAIREYAPLHLKIVSKNDVTRTFDVTVGVNGTADIFNGKLQPWVASTGKCQQPIKTVSTEVDLPAENLNNNMPPVFFNDLRKLTVSEGTRLQLVRFNDFAHVYLHLADSQSKSQFVEHREKIAEYGLQSPPLDHCPQEGEVVLARANDMYNRVKVCSVDGLKCTVFFLDTGNKNTVNVRDLKASPKWVGYVPPLLSVSLAMLSTLRINSACLAALKKLASNKTVLKCKEITNSGMYLLVEQTMTDLNRMLLDLCTPAWKKLHDQGKSLYNLPVASVEEVKFQPLNPGQKIKIMDSAMLIIGAISCMPDVPLLTKKLEDLTKEFEEYSHLMCDPYLPRQFEVCLYKNEAGKWCRACVLEARGDLLDLHSLDDGRIVKEVDFSRTRKMPLEYLDALPALASLCTLQDFPSEPSEKLVERALEIIDANNSVFRVNTAKKNSEGAYDISINSLINALRQEGLL